MNVRAFAFALVATASLWLGGPGFAGCPPCPARAEDATPAPAPAPGDSLLNEYVRGMRDSTDKWFGSSAAPVDTAGLDSALAAGLLRGVHGHRNRAPKKLSIDWGPALGFNRADGGQLGASVSLGTRWLSGLSGRVQYTTGTKDWLGEGGWAHSWRVDALKSRLGLKLAAGRYTTAFDRDYYEPILTSLNAFFVGEDRHHYLRRDGFVSSLRLSAEPWFALAGWRDQLESSLPYTTSLYLFGHNPELPFNDSATFGRVRELTFGGEATIPGTRFRVNAMHWTSDPRMGSDMLFHRTRASAGGDVSVGRHLSLVPQVTYGVLRGETPPQEAFYLGGVANLRTLKRNELAGAGRAFGRVDLILVDDIGKALHLPIPARLPLQLGTFAGSGAVWGRDAVTGDATPTTRLTPNRNEFLSEVGAGVMMRLGIPSPLTSMRFEVAFPIGPDGRGAAYALALQEPMNLLPGR
jgi:hypothetical protein